MLSPSITFFFPPHLILSFFPTIRAFLFLYSFFFTFSSSSSAGDVYSGTVYA
jgi:hypothetical protein